MWKRLARGPRYSCTSVKVGLVTSSSSAASNPAAIPLTSVVFPAPRLPRSRTNLGGDRSSVRVRPKAIVSSAEWVVISRVISNSIARARNLDRARRVKDGRLQSQQAAVRHMVERCSQAAVIIVIKCDEAEGLEHALCRLPHGSENLRHPMYRP